MHRGTLQKIGQESVGLLGGGRALLLQLAHPLVAAGVVDHSDFQADPLLRLQRTMDLMYTVLHGQEDQVEAALHQFNTTHASIRGTLPQAAGPFSTGTAYNGQDPALKWWVLATLIDTQLLMYDRFVAPLPPEERRVYYSEAKMLALRFGIPVSIMPPGIEDFDAYMQSMLSSETLIVTDTARRLAREVLDPAVWIVPRAFAQIARLVTSGLLPENLRLAYGFRWDTRRQATLDGLSHASRLLLPFLPAKLRLIPQARDSGVLEWILYGNRRSQGKGSLDRYSR
ncbi:MAG: DUF2236 domain-containing protein [Chloroflexi bacterium]|nr:DUF2236 domain-containing protein [Chloroflexota bacterium]